MLYKRSVRQKIKFGRHFYGGCGSTLALEGINSMDPDQHPDLTIYVGNTDADHLEEYLGNVNNTQLVKWDAKRKLFPLLLGEQVTGGEGAGTDPKVGLKAAEASRPELRRTIEPNHVNFFTAGGGKGTGGPALQVAAEICEEINQNLPQQERKINAALIVMPHGDEGLSVNANQARDAVLKLIPTFTVYNSEVDKYLKDMSEEEKNNFTTADLNKMVNQAINRIQDTFYEVMLRPGETHLDRADLRNFMQIGKYLYQGESILPLDKKERESVTADQVVEDFFSGHMQSLEIAQNGREAFIWFIGWDPILRKREIMQKTRDFVTQANPELKATLKIHHSIRTRLNDGEQPRVVLWVVASEIKTTQNAQVSPPLAPEQVQVLEVAPPPPVTEPVAATGIIENGKSMLRRDVKPMRIPTIISVGGEEKTVGLFTKHARRYSELKKKRNVPRKEWEALQEEIKADTTFLIDIPEFDWEETASTGVPRAPQPH